MNRRKKRKSNKYINIAIYSILTACFLLFVTAFLLVLFSYRKKNQEVVEAMNQIAILEDEKSQMVTEEKLQEEEEKVRQGMLDTIQNMMEEGNTTLSLLQYLYPDNVVVADAGRYYFFPISPTLAKNNLEEKEFVFPVLNEETGKYEGKLSYKGKDGKKGKLGIDVSKFQGKINWSQVIKDGYTFAILRLGYRGYGSGKIVLDDSFEDNFESALASGIDTGVYFFTESLTEKEAIEEADFVLENLNGAKLTMPVVLDVEESANKEESRTKDLTAEQRTKNVIAFCNRIQEAGYETMIYGNLKSFMLMLDMEQLEDYDKWFAYYRFPLHFPYKIRMWQYSSSGEVSGIKGKTDLNIMFY